MVVRRVLARKRRTPSDNRFIEILGRWANGKATSFMGLGSRDPPALTLSYLSGYENEKSLQALAGSNPVLPTNRCSVIHLFIVTGSVMKVTISKH